ncbi:MAG: inositol monophosphatase family protein [Planctomycetota bacterium]
MNGDVETGCWLEAAKRAALAGGEVLQSWRGRFSVREKSRSNLVTEADEAAQAAIVDVLQKEYPEHGFLGEENLHPESAGAEWMWIIDPLDGTTNYVHGFPYYAVSIALQVAGELELGVIYDPTRGDMFAVRRGCGVELNGVAVRTSGETRASSAFGVGSLPVVTDRGDPAVERFLRALREFQTVQRTGSAALNLAYLASGRIDAFWSSSLKAWDVAAGALMVMESGGSIAGLDGGKFDIFVPSLAAASTGPLLSELLRVLGGD